MSNCYILLPNENVEREPDILKWGAWMQAADRKIANDEVMGYQISTVFLGLDHQYQPGEPPLLFETMIFGEGPLDQSQWRYTTIDEARAGHRFACKLVHEEVRQNA